MIRIDTVIGVLDFYRFTAPVCLLTVFADKGRSAHEVIGTFRRVLQKVFIDNPIDFPLFLFRMRGCFRSSLAKGRGKCYNTFRC